MHLCLSRYQFKRLRHCLTGGEPLNPEVLEQWKMQTGLELYEGYGQTEVVCLGDNICLEFSLSGHGRLGPRPRTTPKSSNAHAPYMKRDRICTELKHIFLYFLNC